MICIGHRYADRVIRAFSVKMKNLKIIIVGAGAAGIAAASRLLENNISNIIVLEAKNRIGGRINSVNFGGSIVDMGAQWCHGENDNVVYKLAKDLNVLSSSINSYDEFTFYESNGKVVERNLADEIFTLANSIGYDEEILKNTTGSFGDYFINRYNNEIKNQFGSNLDNVKIASEFLDWFHKLIICLDAAPTWFDLSAKGVLQYRECEGDKYLHWRDKGYKTILDVLLKKIPNPVNRLPIDDKLYFNKEVSKIVWNENADGVKVSCSDGSSYSCDHLIITLSLGVLKERHKTLFSPPLPIRKQNAIEGLGFGTVNKVFLEFSHQWWTDDPKGFSFIWTNEDRNNIPNEFPFGPYKEGRSWLEDVFGFYPIDSNPKVLLGWIVGSYTYEVEQLPNDIVIDGLMYLLKKFVGHKYNIPQPNDMLCSAWNSDQHFYGSYSYRSIKTEELNVSAQDLAEPVIVNDKKVLLFCGEATHSRYYSTVHGAIETGFREADRIIETYSNPRTEKSKVVIIGAGMAGLGAAHTLVENGCEDILILEAQDEPGGRIKTVPIEDGLIELGAQWIHGTGSYLYKLAEKYNLISPITSEEGLGIYVRDDGFIFDQYLVNEVDFEVGRILEECEKYVNCVCYPHSVGDFVEEKFLKYLQRKNDNNEICEKKLELLDWHVRFQVIDNACRNLRELSAKEWGKYCCIGGNGQEHINLKNGYKSLVDVIVDSLPEGILKCRHPVSKIKWRKDTHNLEVTCISGYTVYCDHVIVTASLGVLKECSSNLFEPLLPKNLSETISCMGYSGIGKFFLIYDYKWWNTEGFQLIWRKNTVLTGRNSWIRYISGFDVVLNQPNVLLGWVGGKGITLMEELSDEDVGLHCTQLFKKFLKSAEIPFPKKIIRSQWSSCPWIKGAYSYSTPQCDAADKNPSTLSEPVVYEGAPRILLAGEACHPNNFSTTHGAFDSGQMQAKLLLNFFDNNF